MCLIRLPARAPLSHLQNPAEVREYSSLLFLLRLLEHESIKSLSLMWKQFFRLRLSAQLQGEQGYATTDGLCKKRPADLCDLILTACCANMRRRFEKNQSQTCSDIWFHCLLICKFLLDNLKVFVMSLRLVSHWEQERRVSSAEAMVLAQSLFLLCPSCSIKVTTLFMDRINMVLNKKC